MEIGTKNLLHVLRFVMSIILAGIIQQSLATPVFSYVDPCNISHTNVASDPIIIMTGNLTDEKLYDCAINITLPEGNGASIEILNSNDDNAYSSFYVEILATSDDDDDKCRQRITTITENSKACALVLGRAVMIFKLHFVNTPVQLKVRGINVISPGTIVGCHMEDNKALVENGVANATCTITQYDTVNTGSRRPWWSYYQIIYEVACPVECTCILGYKKVTTVCNDSVIVSLLVYYTDSTYISFKAQGLAQVTTDAFDGLIGVYEMNLDENRLFTLPVKVFKSLLSMRWLRLSYNILSFLPVGVFDGLSELTHIHMDYNNLVSLEPGVFGGLSELSWLSIPSSHMITLPSGVFNGLANLYTLTLGNNSVASLPVDIFSDLHSLRSLYLDSNLLSSLDVNFDALGQLQSLDLFDNRLSKLSAGVFRGLNNLENIRLGYNRLGMLPSGIFDDLSSVEFIQLESNKLLELPVGIFKGLANLQRLNLHYNRLRSIPHDALTGLVQVDGLKMQHNQLTSLPSGAFKDMHSLFNFDLSYNSLSTLPHNIFDALAKVGSLFLNANQLVNLPDNLFDNMTSLNFLNISDNNLTDLHANVFTSLDKLTFLNISYNRLQALSSLKPLRNIKILDITSNKLRYMTQDTFIDMQMLNFLSLDENNISELPIGIFDGLPSLQILYLRKNYLIEIKTDLFSSLNELVLLKISINRISVIDSGAFHGLAYLRTLDLQYNNIWTLPIGIFDNLTSLQSVNLSYNLLQKVESKGAYTNAINILDLRANDLFLVTQSSFEGLEPSTTILVDESATCCFVENAKKCIHRNPRPVYLTCKRMVDDLLPRVSIWVLGVFAVVCNLFVFYLRLVDKQDKSVQSLLISHLALSDLLMGINMVLLASADAYYAEYFPSYSEFWRKGPICKLTSTLSILSSEVSVILITLITFDRFQGVKYPFSFHRLRRKSAKICLTLIWIIGIIISVLPVVLSGFYSDVYEVSEVCVGIPIVRRPVSVTNISSVEIESRDAQLFSNPYWDWRVGAVVISYRMAINRIYLSSAYAISNIIGTTLATYFSIVIFIGLNLVCFLLVAILYIQIFKTARDTTKKAGRKQTEKEEIRMAMKMSAIVITDFLTWVPLVIVCILVQCQLIVIDPLVYVWTVAFIIPINSAINPFLYTLITLIQNRKQAEKKRAAVPTKPVVIGSTAGGGLSKP